MQRTTVVPDLIKAIHAAAEEALPDVTVVIGYTPPNTAGDYLMVGNGDPESSRLSRGATASQEPGPMGANRARDQLGSVTCCAYSENGGADVEAAIDAVYAIQSQIELLSRTDPTAPGFGVDGVWKTLVGTNEELSTDLDGGQAAALLVFDVSFAARL